MSYCIDLLLVTFCLEWKNALFSSAKSLKKKLCSVIFIFFCQMSILRECKNMNVDVLSSFMGVLINTHGIYWNCYFRWTFGNWNNR